MYEVTVTIKKGHTPFNLHRLEAVADALQLSVEDQIFDTDHGMLRLLLADDVVPNRILTYTAVIRAAFPEMEARFGYIDIDL